jgi:hypothetical protein
MIVFPQMTQKPGVNCIAVFDFANFSFSLLKKFAKSFSFTEKRIYIRYNICEISVVSGKSFAPGFQLDPFLQQIPFCHFLK